MNLTRIAIAVGSGLLLAGIFGFQVVRYGTGGTSIGWSDESRMLMAIGSMLTVGGLLRERDRGF